MGCVIKKKKKSVFDKIIGKIKSDPIPSGQGDITFNISLDDISADNDDVAAITLRRNELRAGKFDNSDAMVSFENNNNER